MRGLRSKKLRLFRLRESRISSTVLPISLISSSKRRLVIPLILLLATSRPS